MRKLKLFIKLQFAHHELWALQIASRHALFGLVAFSTVFVWFLSPIPLLVVATIVCASKSWTLGVVVIGGMLIALAVQTIIYSYFVFDLLSDSLFQGGTKIRSKLAKQKEQIHHLREEKAAV